MPLQQNSLLNTNDGGSSGVDALTVGILGVGVDDPQAAIHARSSTGPQLIWEYADGVDARVEVDENGIAKFAATGGFDFQYYAGRLQINSIIGTKLKWDTTILLLDGNGFHFDGPGIGLNGAAPVAQSAPIADATDATDVIARLNDLLAYLRLRGDIDT